MLEKRVSSLVFRGGGFLGCFLTCLCSYFVQRNRFFICFESFSCASIRGAEVTAPHTCSVQLLQKSKKKKQHGFFFKKKKKNQSRKSVFPLLRQRLVAQCLGEWRIWAAVAASVPPLHPLNMFSGEGLQVNLTCSMVVSHTSYLPYCTKIMN